MLSEADTSEFYEEEGGSGNEGQPAADRIEKSAEMSCKLRPNTSDNERSMKTEPQRGWAVHHRAEFSRITNAPRHGHSSQ